MPWAAGFPQDHLRRHRFPAGERQAMPSRRHGKRWAECPRQLDHSPGLTLDTCGRGWPSLIAHRGLRGRRDHAGARRPASGASGPNRIVGTMTAGGAHGTMRANGAWGATMWPPACSAQSSPVLFRARCCTCLQGLSSSWHDWRRHAASLIRKRSQVRVLDRPLSGNACKAIFFLRSHSIAALRSRRNSPRTRPREHRDARHAPRNPGAARG
jgi:hypothetical protein